MKLKHLLKLMNADEEILLYYGADYEGSSDYEYVYVKDIQYKYLDRKVVHIGVSLADGEEHDILVALNDE